jgi:hypothetical protein
MILPIQAQPILRKISIAELSHINSIDPSSSSTCAGTPSSLIGDCFGSNGPIPGRFNCQACCAFRGAVFWRNGANVVQC